MENKIDELFREKLEHHSVSPNAEVWQKVEANLVKKNNPTWSWRMAAVVLLAGCLLSAILQFQNGTRQDTSIDLAHQNKNTEESKLKPEPATRMQEKTKPANEILKPSLRATPISKTTSPAPSIQEGQSVAQLNTLKESWKEIVVIEEVVPVAANSNPVTAELEKPIVLEFTITAIDPVTVAQAQEKTHGLKKLFTKAKEIKNGEGGIDLYEITNKLFASAKKQDKNNIN